MIYSLNELGIETGTDKARHGYLPFYAEFFSSVKISSLLELGVHKGSSLEMWRKFFPDAHIEGWDRNPVEVQGCLTKKVNLNNRQEIVAAKETSQAFDLILDDAGHRMKDQQLALAVLAPISRYFIIEDLHTSWLSKYYEHDEPSTWDLLLKLSGREFESPYAEPMEKEFVADNVKLRGIYRIDGSERPRSATIILENTAFGL